MPAAPHGSAHGLPPEAREREKSHTAGVRIRMKTSQSSRRSSSSTPSISPVVPLIILETMRDLDRPEEILEDEDITLSLPRRFGLSEVVRLQITKFQEEVRQKRLQLPSQFEDLITLVIRRPDAEEIFREAGRRVAARYWNERSLLMRRLIRLMPRTLSLAAAQRGGRRMFKQLVGGSRMRIHRKPFSLSIDGALTVRADPGGSACAFYSGALAESLELYTGRRYRVLHSTCGAEGHGGCEWHVEIAS